MRVLVVYPDGTGELKNTPTVEDIISEPYVDERPFVNKEIVMLRMYDPSTDIPVNEAVTLRRIKGTVIFCESKKWDRHESISDNVLESILRRFSKIQLKEEKKCTKTYVFWLERLIQLIRRFLTGKK